MNSTRYTEFYEQKLRKVDEHTGYKAVQEWDRMNAQVGLRILHNVDMEENRETHERGFYFMRFEKRLERSGKRARYFWTKGMLLCSFISFLVTLILF